MHKDRIKKSNLREVTQKVRKTEQSFLHTTCCLELIQIAMQFNSEILFVTRLSCTQG